MYKSQEANDWAAKAALIIGSEAGFSDWKDKEEFYNIEIIFSQLRCDVDGPVKLVIDTLSQKLGFNDNRIKKQSSEKFDLGYRGVWIILEPYQERTIG